MKEKMVIELTKVGRTFQATIAIDGKVVWKSAKRRKKHELLVETGWQIHNEKLL